MTTLNEPGVAPIRGHYSLIQFCPDATRLETANIGIALACGSQDFLQVRLTTNNRRVVQMFGRGEQDLLGLRAVKKSLQQTLESGRKDFGSLDELQKFASLHVNHLRMTPFMPCRIAQSPVTELETLFRELVEPRGHSEAESKTRMERILDAAFNTREVSPYIRRDVEVEVPLYRTTETIPYAYQNGRLNLIKPLTFSGGTKSVINKAASNAFEGKSLFETPHDEYGKLQLIVVADFEKTKPTDAETAHRIFEDSPVRMFTTEQIADLKGDILANGHPIKS